MTVLSRERRQEVMEIVGAIAIVASLIFVGLEIRQSGDIARADIYQQRTQMEMSIRLNAIDQDALIAARLLEGSNHDQMSREQRSAWRGHYSLWFLSTENAHFQYQLGLLTHEEWASQRNVFIDFVLKMPCLMDVWERNKGLYRASFAAAIDEGLAGRESAACRW
jgi:hypothetical protein